jgi:hypothetical protein
MAAKCHCACHSVAVRGDRASPGALPDDDRRFRDDDAHPILQIHPQAISLSDPARVAVTTLSACTADVVCHCGWALAVHASERGAFCQFAPAAAPPAAAGAAAIPEALRPLFALNGPSRELFLNDDEEELMYAREPTKQVVGSFREMGQFAWDYAYLTFGT